MAELLASIIFVCSLGGIFFILSRKIPVLIQLSQNGHNGLKKPSFILDAEQKIKDFYFHFFTKRAFLHKILSKIRILILKIERKISETLHIIRKNAQEMDKQNGKK